MDEAMCHVCSGSVSIARPPKMSTISLPPPNTSKSPRPPSQEGQIHTLPMPNSSHILLHHREYPPESSRSLSEGITRRKSTSPPVSLAPIDNGLILPQPQSYSAYADPHVQSYHHPNESDMLTHGYDRRHSSHQPLPSISAHYDTTHHLPAIQSRHSPDYTSHHPRPQPYTLPHPHTAPAPGVSSLTRSPHQPPSPHSPDASFPNAFHPSQSYENHSTSEEQQRMTPPISPTFPVSSSTPSSDAITTDTMPSSLPHPPAVLRRPTSVVSRSGTTQSATPVLPPTTSVAFPGTSVTAPTPTLTAATPVPLSLHDRRERNKAASAKYRAKKHVQSSEMRQQIQVLQEQNRLLTRQLEESRAENTSLKSLVERLKSRIVAQKVLKRLRRVGRDRASSVTTATSGTTTTAPNGTRKRGFGRASGGSHSTNEPAYESVESGMDEDSQDTEIDELEDTLLAQDDDDDDNFDISSQFSDDSEFDDHVERSRRIKRQRRSSKSSAGATKIGSTDFTTDALPSPRRSSASSTGSIESSVSPNTVPSDPSPIVPDLHFE